MCYSVCVWVCFLKFIYLFIYFRAKVQDAEFPRLGVELELQLTAYITATAAQDLSHICDLHYHSRWILNPLSGTRD